MDNELIKVSEVTAIMSGFGDIVKKNTTSIEKCNEAGRDILNTIEFHGCMNEALDKRADEYIDKVKITIKNMSERRKPITQLFDKIRSAFTAQEKFIDPKDETTIPGRLQKMRDDYAKKKYEEEQRRKQEAERIARFNGEKISYRADLQEKLNGTFAGYLNSKKHEIMSMFGALTLSDFERGTNYILLYPSDYPREVYNAFAYDTTTYYLDAQTKSSLRKEVLDTSFETFKVQYREEIDAAKRWCKDRFASKKNELLEIEELRKRDAEAAAEALRLKAQREQAEADKRVAEEAARAEQMKKDLEAKKLQEQMSNMFDQAAAQVTPAESGVKVKEKIKVLHPAGFLAVFNLWWMDEGINLPSDELEKIFKKQITYCEKVANSKDQKHIESMYIEYIDDVKAK